MHKNFSFKGCVTSNDDILASDGECTELVNLRMVNGSLRPIPSPVEVASLPYIYSAIYWHGNASCYLCIRDDASRSIDFYDGSWRELCNSNGEKVEFPSLTMVNAIEIVGNAMCCVTGNGLFYLLFANGEYRFLGERPVMPRLNITYTSKLHTLTTDEVFTTSRIDTELASFWLHNAKGYFDECMSRANKEGYYIDRTLFRFGLRMFDGSYISCSQPIYLSDDNVVEGVERDAGNLVYEQVNTASSDSKFRVMALGFKPSFRFSALELSDWEGVIVGIDLFATGSIMGKKVGTATANLYNSETHESVTEEYEVYVKKELDELYSGINDASLYYKIAEFDINGNCINKLDDVSPSNLALQEMLGSSDVQQPVSSLVAGCSYIFNNRLHVASMREYLFKGYDAFSVCPAASSRKVAEMVVMQTKIMTASGVSTVVNKFDYVELGWNGTYELPALITYPDSRAFEISIFIYEDTELFMKRIPLTPHKYLNMAQYLNKWGQPYKVTVSAVFANSIILPHVSDEDVIAIFKTAGTHTVIYSSEKNSWTYNGTLFPPSEYSGLRIFDIPRNVVDGDKIVFSIVNDASAINYTDIKNISYDSSWQVVSGHNAYGEERPYEDKLNVIKVSKVDNPFLFPAKCTYALSKGNVIALATNTTTMSEGQFGQHPLYAFSAEGIDVLSVDTSGVTAYSNVFPVSNEVCCNNKSLCGIDSGVIFHGSQGIMLICGNRCVKISSAIDCDAKELEIVNRSPVLRSISVLHNSYRVFEGIKFNDFMQDSSIGRDPVMDEILFFNPRCEYCYIYSVTTGVWSKMSGVFAGTVKRADKFILFEHVGSGTRISVAGNSITGSNGVVMFTRPFHFGTKLPKRIVELMLHAYLAKPDGYTGSVPFFSCYLLCSNDGVHFKIVTGCEKNDESRDVFFPYYPTCSYRYFIFALSGTLSSTSMLTGLEMDVSPAWSNRLR